MSEINQPPQKVLPKVETAGSIRETMNRFFETQAVKIGKELQNPKKTDYGAGFLT